MPVDLKDEQILALIEAPKELPTDYEAQLRKMTVRRKHKRSSLEIASEAGRFTIKLRQNTLNVFDFSAILGYHMPGSTRVFLLRRYNGRHRHKNPLEKMIIDDFHVHTATERYQAAGEDEEAYAESTKRYQSLDAALGCLLRDCGFRLPEDTQGELFDSRELWNT